MLQPHAVPGASSGASDATLTTSCWAVIVRFLNPPKGDRGFSSGSGDNQPACRSSAAGHPPFDRDPQPYTSVAHSRRRVPRGTPPRGEGGNGAARVDKQHHSGAMRAPHEARKQHARSRTEAATLGARHEGRRLVAIGGADRLAPDCTRPDFSGVPTPSTFRESALRIRPRRMMGCIRICSCLARCTSPMAFS